MSTRIEGLRGDLRFNIAQRNLIRRNLAGIEARIKIILEEVAEAQTMEGKFSLFDVD